jgi:uncharacterized protein Usg
MKNMKSGNIEGRFAVGKSDVTFSLGLLVYEQEGYKVLYCPELQMTGYGKTTEEAENDLADVIHLNVTYMVNKKTLDKVFKRYGWIVKKSNGAKTFLPPNPMNIIEHNPDYREVLERKHEWKSYKVAIPV